MTVSECYRILGVKTGSDMNTVKAAFRKLAFKLHPDLNPSADAAERFRKVNEAYVILRKTLPEPPKSSKSSQRPRDQEKPEATRREKPKTKADEGAKAYRRQQRKTHPSWTRRDAKWEPDSESTRSRSQRFYYREEEVLKDLMNDPFARQVFEDIYRRVDKSSPNTKGSTSFCRRKINLKFGSRKMHFDISKGLFCGVKGWLRNHLDDEQTVYFPASILMPGRKIRITVQRRFSKNPRMIEVTLPSDYRSGRPIRLRGLGKRVGPWQGDLLLLVLPEEARPVGQ